MSHLQVQAKELATAAALSGMPLSRLLMAAALMMGQWELRMKIRKALGRLDNHLLRDIGIDRAQAQHEAAKPFWEG